jgi:hypothetical protein
MDREALEKKNVLISYVARSSEYSFVQMALDKPTNAL